MPEGGNAKRNRLSRSHLGRRDATSVKHSRGRGARPWSVATCGSGTWGSCFTFKESAAQSNVLGEL